MIIIIFNIIIVSALLFLRMLYCSFLFSYSLRTDPGKVWKVLEFNIEIFKALKTLEIDHRYGKVWKNP